MALLGRGQHEAGNKLFLKANIDTSDEALSLLCRACIMMLIHHDPSTEVLLLEAIELFARQGQKDLMILGKIYLGGWLLGQQKFDEALEGYQQLIEDATINKIPESLKPILYANIGVATLATGNHRWAVEILKTAIQHCFKTSNGSADYQLLFYYAWSSFFIGNFAETITNCQKALNIVNTSGGSFVIERIYALLIFSNLILGRNVEANQLLAVFKGKHEKNGSAGCRLTEIIKAFHEGDFIRTENLCSSEEMLLFRADIPTLLSYQAQIIYSWFLFKKNRAEAAKYVNSILYFGKSKSLFHLMFCGIIFKILLSDIPEIDQNREIVLQLEISETTGNFNPYWFLIADLLASRKIKALETYVLRQYKLSPNLLRNSALKILQSWPELIKLIKPSKQPGTDRFMIINSKEIKQINASDFGKYIITSSRPNFILFDASSRRITFNGQRSVLRQNTLQMALLSFLFQNQARRQPIKNLFEAVWQTEFDEEFSTDTVKAVIKRLNSWFKQRALPMRLSIISVTGRRFVCIDIDTDWEGIFPLDKAKGNTCFNGQGFSGKQE
jgi:tetratricopeptide (TPR) repeat protein